MRRFVFIFIGVILLAGSLGAQAPEGWQVRIDRSTSATDPDDVPDIKVAIVGKGFRVTGGPAGTFWNPTNLGKGNFTARGTFTLMKPSGHVNYYGLVFGGEELGAARQRYIYSRPMVLSACGSTTCSTCRWTPFRCNNSDHKCKV